MGKSNDLSPRKIGQISILLSETSLKQKEIANKLGVSKQTVSRIKKKIENNEELDSNRVGPQRTTTPRLDRRIVHMALDDRRASCNKISRELSAEGINVNRKTINNRLLEAGLRAYRPRKKPRLTKKMMNDRYNWAKNHLEWTSEDWEQVRIRLSIINSILMTFRHSFMQMYNL